MATFYTYVTGNGAVVTGAAKLRSVHLAAGSNAATASIYDDAAAGPLTGQITKLATGANTTAVFMPSRSLDVVNGIYVALTGTSPVATVIYDL